MPALPGGLNGLTTLLVLFSICHAVYALGPRNAGIFFVGSAVVSWAFEQAGVATGLVFGPYHYTSLLGPKLGDVPILIPGAWFMMMYPSYVIAGLIVDGRPFGTRGRPGHVAWLAAIGAAVMTAWDVVVDPILSGPGFRAWVWERGGPYLGVPVQNYVGWLLTTFTVFALYRGYERFRPPTGVRRWDFMAGVLPLVAYGSMLVANLVAGGPSDLVVIGPFVMGVPLLTAAGRLRLRRSTILA
jgi:putative membrane protein